MGLHASVTRPTFCRRTFACPKFACPVLLHGMELPDSIEVHAAELTKYNLQEAAISVVEAVAVMTEDRMVYDQRPVEG
jgi:hypothetical protein